MAPDQLPRTIVNLPMAAGLFLVAVFVVLVLTAGYLGHSLAS